VYEWLNFDRRTSKVLLEKSEQAALVDDRSRKKELELD
jgi:hypothetical protein